jgi:hypothetical protein
LVLPTGGLTGWPRRGEQRSAATIQNFCHDVGNGEEEYLVMALRGIRTWRARGIAGGGRAVDSAGVRWQAVTEPPRCGDVRARALARTRGHVPSWAIGTRALPI